MVVWLRGKTSFSQCYQQYQRLSQAPLGLGKEPRLPRFCLPAPQLLTPLFVLLAAGCCQSERDQKPRLDSAEDWENPDLQ